MALVSTLLKASVYSTFMNHENLTEDGEFAPGVEYYEEPSESGY